MVSNKNYSTETAKRIPIEHVSILSPREGASYMHHSCIIFYKGKFYVTFSLGEIHEDDCRQKVMMAVSEDGVHFSEPVEIFSGKELGDPDLVTAGAPSHVDEKTGKLIFAFGAYAWDPAYLVNGHRRDNNDYGKLPGKTYIKEFDGESFSPAKPSVVGVLSKIADGHYLSVNNISVVVASDQYGTDAKHVNVLGLTEEELSTGDVVQTIAERSAQIGAPYYLCETQYWDRGNGKLRLFFRPEKYFPEFACERFKGSEIMQKAIPLSKEEYHYAADSEDWGHTWTLPYKTDFKGDVSLMALGRLPDNGPYYYVGNEDASRLYHRDPLVLSLSDDGENFDRHYIIAHGGHQERFRGICKGGMFAYPHVLIHEGYMYVSYTIFKEEIAVARIALADLK